MKNDVGIIKEQVTEMNHELNGLHIKLDQLEKKLDLRFTSLEGKFEQMLQLLTSQRAKEGE